MLFKLSTLQMAPWRFATGGQKFNFDPLLPVQGCVGILFMCNSAHDTVSVQGICATDSSDHDLTQVILQNSFHFCSSNTTEGQNISVIPDWPTTAAGCVINKDKTMYDKTKLSY